MLIFMVLYINDKLLGYDPATFYVKKWVRRLRMTQVHCLKNFSKSVNSRLRNAFTWGSLLCKWYFIPLSF